MMKVIETPISPFLQNAPIAFCEKSMESIFFDPGDEIEKLLNTSLQHKLKPKYICLTHGHIDHAGSALELSQELKLPIIGPHINDKFLFWWGHKTKLTFLSTFLKSILLLNS